jgi:hypothetical protein
MDMQNRTLINTLLGLYEQGIPKVHIAKRLNKNRGPYISRYRTSKNMDLSHFWITMRKPRKVGGKEGK